MRIVGGAFRGRKLLVPGGKLTRPTTERVREALFNMLGTTVQQRSVLDLYAGSGSLGIEALSRGARQAVFVEIAKSAADAVRANLSAVSLTDSQTAHVVQRPIEHSIDTLRRLGPFDLCLIDPPFASVRDGSALRAVQLVASSHVLTQDAILVIEYPSDQPDPSLGGLTCFDVRGYGDTRLAFFRPTEPGGNIGLGDPC